MSKRSRNEVTIREVAASAHVSMMTVSNVLNERFERMHPQTRNRVEQAINALKYRPHAVARSLRRSERLSIGLLFIDDDETFITHPGHSYVVDGLSKYLNDRGYSLTLQGLNPARLSEALPIRSVDTDGLCIVQSGQPARRMQTLRALAALSQPCVLIHENKISVEGDFCQIRENDRAGGRLLAQHLVHKGCRNILLLLPTTIWASMEERAVGSREVCKRGGVTLSTLRTRSSTMEDAQEALSAYLDVNEHPDGIIAGNDQLGIATLRVLKARGLEVPRQVRVTGFNAFELWKYSEPRLTTIRTPAAALGVRAGEELVRRLTSGSFSGRDIVLPVEMLEGSST